MHPYLEVDFQVEAMTGHIDLINSGPIGGDGYYSFTGQFSDWSNTQTLTSLEPLHSETPAPSPSLTPTTVPSITSSLSPIPSISPTQPVTKKVFPIWGYVAFAALVFVIGVLVGVVVMQRRKIRSGALP